MEQHDYNQIPLKKGDKRGCQILAKKKIYMVNPHEPKAHKEHKNIPPSLNPSRRSTELTTKSREGEFPRPLWERIKVRGIIVLITIVHRFRIRIIYPPRFLDRAFMPFLVNQNLE